MMKRRRFSALAASAAASAWAAAPYAQQKPMPVIGWLNPGAPEPVAPFLAAFRQGLADSGYIEGQNVAIEYRWAENRNDRLPALAAELVGRKVDVLVTGAGGAAARAAQNATSTIPIVFGTSDPVAIGLVTSMARPTANLTGVGYLVGALNLKRFDLLLQAIPQLKVVGLLVNPNNINVPKLVPDMQDAARSHGVQLVIARAASESEIEQAFDSFMQAGTGAVVIQADPYIHSRRARLLALAAQHSLPAIYTWSEFATEGGLISYGPSHAGVYRQIGNYAGRILKGAKPADLPVVQPTTFELIINMKTARTLGLTLPPAILALADELIE
jgi:putative ABC transport system substrate-binding protein